MQHEVHGAKRQPALSHLRLVGAVLRLLAGFAAFVLRGPAFFT
jgi:hypothetical protein